jgi:leucyl aminopeptidase
MPPKKGESIAVFYRSTATSKKLIKSDLADVCNVSSKPYGGAITAALFLDHSSMRI